MNTAQLKYFLSAAKTLSFSETAKEFYMTQPAISHQIVELEQELGTKLFSRNSRGVQLTKAGELFLEDAKRFLDMTEQSKEKLQTLNAGEGSRLTIGYLVSPCKYFLPNVIHQFRQAYPQVEIELVRLDAQAVLSSIETSTYDIYFSLMEDLKHFKNYNIRKIHQDPYCLICRTDHPCLNNFMIDYDKLATEPFLMFDPERSAYMSHQIHQVCRELNFTPRIVQKYDSMEEVLFAVESGLGITILPYKVMEYYRTNLVYTPLDGSNIASAVGAAWKNAPEHPAVNWFMAELNQYMIQAALE
ncbi:MAG: LysR family transcriptional regulator [Eubacterium sp.]|nr:LysR family transcriptional regulator [Eubacterium sp.]